jgi:hypothetical protein
VADLKRRNEELAEDNGRRARKDDENATLLSTQKAKQEEQVWRQSYDRELQRQRC